MKQCTENKLEPNIEQVRLKTIHKSSLKAILETQLKANNLDNRHLEPNSNILLRSNCK
jgi:hypothetical protein